MRRVQKILIMLGTLAFLAAAPLSHAQLNGTSGTINLNAVVNPQLTVAAGPATVNFALPPNGLANGSSTIAIQTSWALNPSVGAVKLYAYFTTAGAALSDGAGSNIASSRVLGSPNGGAFAPFTGASPFAASSSITVFTETIFGFNKTKTRNDTLDLRIDTTGLGLRAGTYTGQLLLRAQAL